MIRFPNNYDNLTVDNLPDSAKFYVLKLAIEQLQSDNVSILYIADSEKEADEIYKILKKLLGNVDNFSSGLKSSESIKNGKNKKNILLFPSWDILPYDNNSPKLNVISRRIKTLYELLKNEKNNIVITTIDSFLTKIIPKNIIKNHILELEKNSSIKMDHFTEFLVNNSYIRVDSVNEVGEFSVKGDIIDIFPSSYDSPVRIDLFGNSIERIREFDPITQISINILDKVEKVEFLPATEVIINDEFCSNFKQNYKNLFDINYKEDMLYDAVANNRSYIGVEHYLPLFYNNQLETLIDYISNPIIIYSEELKNNIGDKIKKIENYYNNRKDNNDNIISPSFLYLSEENFINIVKNNKVIKFNLFESSSKYAINSNIQTIPNFFLLAEKKKKTPFLLCKDFLIERVKNTKKKKKIIVTAHNEITLKRLKNIFKEYEICDIDKIEFLQIRIDCGFYTENEIFISEQDLLGKKIIRNIVRERRKADKLILEISSLSIGELVVHADHGVGRFLGLKILDINKVSRDFMQIEYADNNKLYLPVENLDLISRYGSSNVISLDKLGASSFQYRKAILKKKLRDIAEDLLKQKGERDLIRGIKFHADEHLYEEFVAKFPYDETEDQMTAIEDVLNDLSSGKNMDRLICGDVGFGKTEIAMRAIFTVLTGNSTKEKSQTSIIVPTTLLARQHYNNFLERFKDFGFNIALISRMVGSKKLKQIKLDLEEGKIDIVIGTHALLGKNIKFKNLSLVILDEEQHFGVVQKERIKKFKNNLHLLSLSATPIPRTLQMSLNNIRDMSLIMTPPVDRLAIKSFVMPFDDITIREAILREYYRGGRVFFICSKIKDLEKQARKLKKFSTRN